MYSHSLAIYSRSPYSLYLQGTYVSVSTLNVDTRYNNNCNSYNIMSSLSTKDWMYSRSLAIYSRSPYSLYLQGTDVIGSSVSSYSTLILNVDATIIAQ